MPGIETGYDLYITLHLYVLILSGAFNNKNKNPGLFQNTASRKAWKGSTEFQFNSLNAWNKGEGSSFP